MFVALAGAVAGALVVGAVWTVSAAGGGGTSSTGIPVDSSTIAAPDQVGTYLRFSDIEINRSGQGATNARLKQSWNSRSAQRLSTRYGGSGATVETYADDHLESNFVLLAVRAPSPFPQFVPYQDAEAMGFAVPPDEVQEFGAVSCQVANQPPPLKGEEPTPDSVHVVSCLRTGPGLTVEIRQVEGDLNNQPGQVAVLVDQAWSTLS